MRTVICGGRNYEFTQDDVDYLESIRDEITIVIQGGATGADAWAKAWAIKRDIPMVEIPAEWNKHGNKAGPLRNKLMALLADRIIAFPGGSGTKNMIDWGLLYGKEVIQL